MYWKEKKCYVELLINRIPRQMPTAMLAVAWDCPAKRWPSSQQRRRRQMGVKCKKQIQTLREYSADLFYLEPMKKGVLSRRLAE